MLAQDLELKEVQFRDMVISRAQPKEIDLDTNELGALRFAIVVHGAEFERWAGLTQIGRLAWFWQARNRAILEQFSRLPLSHCRILRLEDFDYPHYREIVQFLGWQPRVEASTFADLARARPNAGPNPPRRFPDWNPVERAEFEAEVGPLAEALGYEYRTRILEEQPTTIATRPLSALPTVLTRVSTSPLNDVPRPLA